MCPRDRSRSRHAPGRGAAKPQSVPVRGDIIKAEVDRRGQWLETIEVTNQEELQQQVGPELDWVP